MPDQNKYTSKLAGARVLVIGGSSGIGLAVAEASIEYGALVTIASSNESRIAKTMDVLKTSYPSAASRIFGVRVDLSKPDTLESELRTMLSAAVSTMGGRLNHVIYTAGDALATSKLADMSMRTILAAGQVRFFAPLLLAKFLSQYVEISYKSSYIITTGSISEKPVADWSVIASYAGGHHAMVRNLALDLKPIRVNGVSPGVVDTELWKEKDDKEQWIKERGEEMPTGRPGHAEDVAEGYLAIMRDGNMDGSVVRTDGGAMLP